MYFIKKLVVGQMYANCYLVHKNHSCVIIDPGDEADFISKKIEDFNLIPKALIITHGHVDHVMACYELINSYNIPFYIDKDDEFLVRNLKNTSKHWFNRTDILSPKITQLFKNKLLIEGVEFEIIKIPGHTPGSVAFYNKKEKLLFSGDLIFKGGGLGRVDFSYSNKNDFPRSLKKILSLPKDTVIYPGHGDEFILSEFNV